MEQKEEYKETELGFLPESWGVDNLENEYIGFKNGLWKGKKEPFVKAKVLRNTNFKNDGTIRLNNIAELDVEEKQFKTREIINGDIILERSGGGPAQPVGRVVFFDIEEGFNYSFSNFTSRIRVVNKEKIFSKYLFYFLLYFYMSGKTNDIQNRTTGIRNLDFSKYKQIYIPLPPLPEQKKIANVLSIIQEAKEKTENVINSLKELKKSMMKHLFTYGPVSLEEAEKVKLKDTEIGMVPEEWEVNNIGELYNVKQGKQISAKESKEGKIKKSFLRTSNLTWGKINILKVDSMYFTKEKFGKLKLKKGDILTCEGGDIGRTAIYDDELEECAYQNHLHRLRPKTSDTNNLFFVYWMNYAANQRKLYVFDANRTTIPNLSGSRLKNLKIPKPKLSEQQQISSTLSAIDTKIESEENKKNTLEELFKSTLHNLMTAKIRVNELEI